MLDYYVSLLAQNLMWLMRRVNLMWVVRLEHLIVINCDDAVHALIVANRYRQMGVQGIVEYVPPCPWNS